MQRLSPEGVPKGSIMQLNTETLGPQQAPSGVYNPATKETLFAWQSGFIFNPPVPGSLSVWARRIGANGEPIGNDFRVPRSMDTLSSFPNVATDLAGNYFFVYQEDDQTTIETWPGGQFLSPDGTFLGQDLQLNSYDPGAKLGPSIAGPLDDGTYLVAWSSTASPGDDDSLEGVVARVWRGPPAPALAIPAANTKALLGLALLIASAALWLLRRR